MIGALVCAAPALDVPVPLVEALAADTEVLPVWVADDAAAAAPDVIVLTTLPLAFVISVTRLPPKEVTCVASPEPSESAPLVMVDTTLPPALVASVSTLPPTDVMSSTCHCACCTFSSASNSRDDVPARIGSNSRKAATD